MTTSDVSLDDLMLSIQKARSAMQSAPLKESIDKINHERQQFETNIHARRQEQQREEQELQEELDELKRKLDELSRTHDLAALDREREELEADTCELAERTREMETEVEELEKELHGLENKEMDLLSKDFASLMLVVYRGLGVRAIHEDGPLTKLQLTSPDNRGVQIFDVSKGYTSYYIAKKIWQYLTPSS